MNKNTVKAERFAVALNTIVKLTEKNKKLESAMEKLITMTNRCAEKQSFDGYVMQCIDLSDEYKKLLEEK